MSGLNFKLLLFFSFWSVFSYGQNISIGLAQNHSGKNIQLCYLFSPEKKWSFETGLKYHLNNLNEWDSRGFSYQYRFFASKPIEHFGLYHSTKYKLYSSSNSSNIYVFHNFQLNRLAIKSTSFDHFGDVDPVGSFDSAGRRIYYRLSYVRPAIFTIENNFGIGIRAKFSERLALNLEAGTGIAHFFDSMYLYKDPNTGDKILHPGTFTYDPFTPHLRVGLAYNIKKKTN